MQLSIAVGRSRETKVWRNQETTWPELVTKFKNTIRTPETFKDYLSFSKEKQSQIKDQGGFVGGYLTAGKRSPSTVKFRQLLTLDLDTLPPESEPLQVDLWDNLSMLFGYEALLHSTHKHAPKAPRYRIVIPIERPVSAEEYEAIARKFASYLDIDLFDPTTFQPERLMYWPTTAKDGVYTFRHKTGNWLNADEMLSRYVDWQDISEWPMHEAESDFSKLGGKEQGRPADKPGHVGAFCRVYNIHDAIREFLSDIYEPTGSDDRYTFKGGSGAAGAIVYNDEFIYSHHGTDPAHMQLLNAFDLVRIHKYGFEDTDKTIALSKRKSHKLMCDLATTKKDVVKEMGIRKLSAAEEFNDGTEFEADELDWIGELTIDKYGQFESTIPNIHLMLANDLRLKGKLKYDEFSTRQVGVRPLPWDTKKSGLHDLTDDDDAALRHYLEKKYHVYQVAKTKDALAVVSRANSFHPIKEYLETLPKWDGENRVESLLMDYLSAKDTQFTRDATRKTLCGAIARIFEPGCKFDYTLTLVGPEGKGKSSLFRALGKEWFSDSFAGVEGKQAFEQLQGAWIIEIGELAGLKKAENESVKHYLTKQDDRFRVAYGHRNEKFLRQGIFIATTNEFSFLKGPYGNRKYWPVEIKNFGLLDIKDMPIDQIWAEAMMYYKRGEQLYFDVVAEEAAKEIQLQHTEIDDRKGIILNYLNTLLPDTWETMETGDRRAYLSSPDTIKDIGEVQRLSVCAAEIWCEVIKAEIKDMTTYNTKFIHDVMRDIEEWEPSISNLTFPIYGRQRTYVLKNKYVTHSNKRKADRK